MHTDMRVDLMLSVGRVLPACTRSHPTTCTASKGNPLWDERPWAAQLCSEAMLRLEAAL